MLREGSRVTSEKVLKQLQGPREHLHPRKSKDCCSLLFESNSPVLFKQVLEPFFICHHVQR